MTHRDVKITTSLRRTCASERIYIYIYKRSVPDIYGLITRCLSNFFSEIKGQSNTPVVNSLSLNMNTKILIKKVIKICLCLVLQNKKKTSSVIIVVKWYSAYTHNTVRLIVIYLYNTRTNIVYYILIFFLKHDQRVIDLRKPKVPVIIRNAILFVFFFFTRTCDNR